MGDDEGGTACQQVFDALLYQQLGFGVDAGGGLIQNEDGGIGNHGAGKGEELLLADGQAAAPFAQYSVIALFQPHDEVMGIHRFGSSYDFIIRCVKLSIADVVPDGAGEQEVVLGHDAHLPPQAFDGNLLHVMAVDVHMALLNVVKTADQIDDGGFSGSGRSHQRDGFAGTDVKAHIV